MNLKIMLHDLSIEKVRLEELENLKKTLKLKDPHSNKIRRVISQITLSRAKVKKLTTKIRGIGAGKVTKVDGCDNTGKDRSLLFVNLSGDEVNLLCELTNFKVQAITNYKAGIPEK